MTAPRHANGRLAALTLAAAALAPAGCGDSNSAADEVGATAGMGGAASRYPVRTDWLVDKAPDVAPTRWNTPGYPPLRSLSLAPNTPDADLLDGLRSERAKRNFLNPTTDIPGKDRAEFGRVLDRVFGTPTNPAVRLPKADELKKLGAEKKDVDQLPEAEAAKAGEHLDDATLARGGVLFRRWCMHCHGPTGGGDGSNAFQLQPPPRDYRQGVFKFVTSGPDAAGRPLRADLKRTIRKGLDGSMMLAFPNFTDKQLDDVVSYVIHLSARGETEYRTMKRAIKYNDDFGTIEGELLTDAVRVLAAWERPRTQEKYRLAVPPENTPKPDDVLASAARGHKAFGEAGCAACHSNYGRIPVFKYDIWGTVVQPRNLTLGLFRAGRNGDELYARLYTGIPGAGMPGHKGLLDAAPRVDGRPDKIWDLVHFVQGLSDPATRRGLAEKYQIVIE